jgi:hypothetical protein
MRKDWSNMSPKKFGKNHVCLLKLVVNYARSSGTHSCIKFDSTVPRIMSPAELKAKNDCTGEDQQQFSSQLERK